MRAIKSILVVTYEAISSIIFSLPRYHLFGMLKSTWLRMIGARIGRRVIYYPGVWIMSGRNLVIGDDVDLALDVMITSDGGVVIGDRVLIGYRTMIFSRNHVIPENRADIFSAGHISRPVEIGDDTWIGGGCTIVPGVTIGTGCVIGAGSVVTKSVPDYCIVAGNPAKVIRNRN